MATLLDMLQAKAPQQAPMARNTALEQTAQDIRYSPALRPSPERTRNRGPSLLDTIWGVAAGYSPGDTRRRIAMAEMDQEKAQMELAAAARASSGREEMMAQITDPRERAIALANPGKWGEFAGERYVKPHSLARGAQLTTGTGQVLASNNFTHTLGDVEIVEILPDGSRVSHVRENLSPDEVAKIEDQNIRRQEMAQQSDLTREGYAVQREGQAVTMRGQDLDYERSLNERADKIDELNEPTRQELRDYQSLGTRIQSMMQSALGDPGSGTPPAFEIGPVNAAKYEAELRLGRPSAEAAAYGMFRTNVQGIVNESLRLNNGVQTEGDAKRETDNIMRNIHNPTYVEQRLLELDRINQRAIRSREETISRREARVNRPSQVAAPAARPRQGNAPRVGQTATNPSTGARIRWNGSAWVPA